MRPKNNIKKITEIIIDNLTIHKRIENSELFESS